MNGHCVSRKESLQDNVWNTAGNGLTTGVREHSGQSFPADDLGSTGKMEIKNIGEEPRS